MTSATSTAWWPIPTGTPSRTTPCSTPWKSSPPAHSPADCPQQGHAVRRIRLHHNPSLPTPCPSTTSPTPTGCDPTSPMPSSGSISELRRTDGRRLCPHPGLVEEAERQTSCFGVPKLGDCDQPVQLAPHAVIGRHDAVDPSGFRSVHNATLAAFLENRKAMVLSPLWLKTPQSCGSDARHSASPLC